MSFWTKYMYFRPCFGNAVGIGVEGSVALQWRTTRKDLVDKDYPSAQ